MMASLQQPHYDRALAGFYGYLLVIGWSLALLVVGVPAGADEPPAPGQTIIRARTLTLWRGGGSEPGAGDSAATVGERIVDGPWSIRVERSSNPLAGVPWRIIYERLDETEDHAGHTFECGRLAETVPVVELPAQLWAQWMGADLHDVVGILFADLLSPEEVKILYTAHAEVDATGTPVSPTRSRLEATLLTPLTCAIDLAILVRQANDEGKTARRLEHERGHAEHTLCDVITTLAGPQDWDSAAGAGQRSELVFRWRDKLVKRTWKGYRGTEGKLQTRRFYITVVPPTRWSRLYDKASEGISQEDRLAFNEQLTLLQSRFRANWDRSRLLFHQQHGAAEREPLPDFPAPSWP